VATELNIQSILLNEKWTARPAAALRLGRLLKVFKMRAQQLLKIRERRALPGNGEYPPGRRGEFADHHATRSPQFMYRVIGHLPRMQAGMDSRLVGLNRRYVAAQGSKGSHLAKTHKSRQDCEFRDDLVWSIRRTGSARNKYFRLDFAAGFLGCLPTAGVAVRPSP